MVNRLVSFQVEIIYQPEGLIGSFSFGTLPEAQQLFNDLLEESYTLPYEIRIVAYQKGSPILAAQSTHVK
jgi:hypothetical protein